MSRRRILAASAERPLAASLALMMALSGCAVGPDFTGAPPLAVPVAWTGTSAATRPIDGMALGAWWKDFRDPLLDRLMTEAVEGNLDVAAAKARIRTARAARREAIGGLLPTLDGSGSATRLQSAATGAASGPVVSSLFKTGFDAGWEIDLFGGNARAVEAADHAVGAGEEDLRATLLTLVGDVASNYVEARGNQARMALARRTATSQRKTAALTRTKFQVGSASAIDTAKADAIAASTEADIPGYEAAYVLNVHRLSVLTGRAPGALTADLSGARPIPRPNRRLPTGIPADVLRNRPDVRAAEARLAQYTAAVGQAEAALYPSVSLTGSLATSAIRPGDLAKASTISWSWGPSVSVPFFEGGRLIAARDGAEATRDQYFVAWKSSVLTALEDVENALVSLRQERIKSGKLSESAAAYRTAADLSRKLYANGSASFLDVLDAERSLYTAEGALIQSRIALTTDTIALAKALGGGWTGPVDASRPEIVDHHTGPRLARLPLPAGE